MKPVVLLPVHLSPTNAQKTLMMVLRIATESLKRLIVGGMERVYEITCNGRNGATH